MADVWELESWDLAMRAERRSGETIKSAMQAMILLGRWLESEGRPRRLSGRVVREWLLAEQEARGWGGGTCRTRLQGVKSWARWAAEEGVLAENIAGDIARIARPMADEKVVEALPDDSLREMLRVCGGDFLGVRDRAMLSLLLETGLRMSELLALELEDVRVRDGVLVVRKSKTRRGRLVPFSAQAGRALDRYLRARRRREVREGSEERFWLAVTGRGLEYHGAWKSLSRRAEDAGVGDFHPHALRNTAAVRWLRAGGSENSLRVVAGWTPGSKMLARYVAGAAAERAVEEAQGLGLGLG